MTMVAAGLICGLICQTEHYWVMAYVVVPLLFWTDQKAVSV
jgi:hypothetical protein